MMFDGTVDEGVVQLAASDVRWLSTGFDGGYRIADAAYNVSVPTGWDTEAIDEYVEERLRRTDFEESGPTLLTGVDLEHLRGARMEPVVAYATVGLSNPASLPATPDPGVESSFEQSADAGTVNLLLGTTRSLTDGALATLLATAVEAKTATLLSLSGFTGTATDAVIVGTPTVGDQEHWAGSGTEIGNATRVCVRDAIRASFESRYADTELPGSVVDADHGVVTRGEATVFEP